MISPIDSTSVNCDEITGLIQPDRVGPVDPRQLPIAEAGFDGRIGGDRYSGLLNWDITQKIGGNCLNGKLDVVDRAVIRIPFDYERSKKIAIDSPGIDRCD
jgi:hypothetical protein